MKKRPFLLLTAALLLSSFFAAGCAEDRPVVSSHIEVSDALKRKYYKQGYEKGYKQGYEHGYDESFAYYLTNLKKWERDILALETGKYLIEKKLIPPPRIYRLVVGSGGEVQIRGGEISLPSLDKIVEAGIFIPEWKAMQPVTVTTAQEALDRSYDEFTPINPLEKIYYDKGFTKGYQDGYQAGRTAAKEEIADFIQKKYGRRIKALELEKYLSDKTFITVPRVYSIVIGTGYRIVTVPPRIEPLRTIEDILNGKYIPAPDFTTETTIADTGSGYRLPSLAENSFNPDGEEVAEIIKVPVSQKTLPLLEKLAIPYLQKDNKFYAVFFDKGQKESFCRTYRVCR